MECYTTRQYREANVVQSHNSYCRDRGPRQYLIGETAVFKLEHCRNTLTASKESHFSSSNVLAVRATLANGCVGASQQMISHSVVQDSNLSSESPYITLWVSIATAAVCVLFEALPLSLLRSRERH